MDRCRHHIATVGSVRGCRVCDRHVYGASAHPCCLYWQRQQPGTPCRACSASRGAPKARKKVTEVEYDDPAISWRTERLLHAIRVETVEAMVRRYEARGMTA